MLMWIDFSKIRGLNRLVSFAGLGVHCLNPIPHHFYQRNEAWFLIPKLLPWVDTFFFQLEGGECIFPTF